MKPTCAEIEKQQDVAYEQVCVKERGEGRDTYMGKKENVHLFTVEPGGVMIKCF